MCNDEIIKRGSNQRKKYHGRNRLKNRIGTIRFKILYAIILIVTRYSLERTLT